MDRFLLDSDVYDQLLLRPDVVGKLRRLVDSGLIVLITTHVQRDQVSAVPGDDPERAAALLALFASLSGVAVEVPTGAWALGVSPLAAARLSGEEEAEDFDARLRTRPVHFRTNTGELLCWDGDADLATTDDPQGATCMACREGMGRETRSLLRHRHTGDALLIETARVEDAVFVTHEVGRRGRGRVRKAAPAHGVDTWHSDDFFAWVLGQEGRRMGPVLTRAFHTEARDTVGRWGEVPVL